MELINIFISILIVLFVSLILKIELKNILVIVIISTIVLFILAIKENKFEDPNLYTINKHIRNLNHHILNSNNLAENNLAEKSVANKLENNLENNLVENNNLGKKNCKLMTTMDNIIDPCMYNLEDCTTDMTCIQKPNKYNLFPRHNENIPKVPKSKKVDGIVIENFISSSNPFQMNDLSVPFNSSIIDPYEHYEMIKNEKLGDEVCSEALGNDLCFHCRKGHCIGGVCRNVSESKPGKILNTKNNKVLINAHPYSENQPVIRVSNPDYSI